MFPFYKLYKYQKEEVFSYFQDVWKGNISLIKGNLGQFLAQSVKDFLINFINSISRKMILL